MVADTIKIVLLVLLAADAQMEFEDKEVGKACTKNPIGNWVKKQRITIGGVSAKFKPTEVNCKRWCAENDDCQGFNLNVANRKKLKCYFQGPGCMASACGDACLEENSRTEWFEKKTESIPAETASPTTAPTGAITESPSKGPTAPTIGVARQRAPEVANAPHIIFAVADDMGWNDLSGHQNDAGSEGHQGIDIKTPNIDQMMSEGVELYKYYTQSVCSPTRAAILTGRYPSHNGIGPTVVRPCDNYAVPATERFMPLMMKMNGYRTYAVGKWHLGHLAPRHTPVGRGFDYHFGMFLGEQDYFTHFRYLRNRYHEGQPLWRSEPGNNKNPDGSPEHMIAHDFWRHRTTFWEDLEADGNLHKYNNNVNPELHREDMAADSSVYPPYDDEPDIPDDAALLLDALDAEICDGDGAVPDGHELEYSNTQCMNKHYATFRFVEDFEENVVKKHIDDKPMFVFVAFTAPHEGQGIRKGGAVGGNADTTQDEIEYINQTPEGVYNGVDYGTDDNHDAFYEEQGWSEFCKGDQDLEHKSRCEYGIMLYAMDQAIGMLRTTMEGHCAHKDTLETIEFEDLDECKDGKAYWDSTLFIFNSDNGGYNKFSTDPIVRRVARRNGNNYPLMGYKTTMWEGGIRVPAFIRGTDNSMASIDPSWTGKRYHGVFHAVDWYKTVADMAVKDATDRYRERNPLDSISHWNVLQNSRNDWSVRDQVRQSTIHQAVPYNGRGIVKGAIRKVVDGVEYKLVLGSDRGIRITDATMTIIHPDGYEEKAANRAKKVNVSPVGEARLYRMSPEESTADADEYDVQAIEQTQNSERINLLYQSVEFLDIATELYNDLKAYSEDEKTLQDLNEENFSPNRHCFQAMVDESDSKPICAPTFVKNRMANYLDGIKNKEKRARSRANLPLYTRSVQRESINVDSVDWQSCDYPLYVWGPHCGGTSRDSCDATANRFFYYDYIDRTRSTQASDPPTTVTPTSPPSDDLSESAVVGIVFAAIAGGLFVSLFGMLLAGVVCSPQKKKKKQTATRS